MFNKTKKNQRKKKHNLEIITHDPSIDTMDHPKSIVKTQEEESISSQRVPTSWSASSISISCAV